MRKSESLIFICAPLRDYVGTDGRLHSVEENIVNARAFGKYCVDTLGYRKSFVPHRLGEILDARDKEEDSIGAVMSIAALGQCNAIAVCGDYVSPGMRREIERAEELGIYTVGIPADALGVDTNVQAGYSSSSVGIVGVGGQGNCECVWRGMWYSGSNYLTHRVCTNCKGRV